MHERFTSCHCCLDTHALMHGLVGGTRARMTGGAAI